jgi:hypothetical protein
MGGTGVSTLLAQTDTYVFTAAIGQDQDFNGSTITIDGLNTIGAPLTSGVTAFTFYDTALGSTAFTSGTVAFDIVLNYDIYGWVGEFAVITGPGLGFEVSKTNFYGPGGAAAGTWAYVPAAGPVPDDSWTLPLLATGVGATVIWVSRIRSSAASGKQRP